MVTLKKHKRRVKFILKRKLKFYTKEVLKFFNVTLIALGFIVAIVLIKYKPIYEVRISGEEVGYINNKKQFEEIVKNDIENYSAKNIEKIEIKEKPEYELKLVEKQQETNESEIVVAMQRDINITYKYYDIVLNDETIETVDTQENAEQIIKEVNQENLKIEEKTTNDIKDVTINELEIAKSNILQKTGNISETNKSDSNSICDINGIKVATIPVSGTISSRYGVSSRIRVSTHTGLDISATKGTPIKVIADGIVTAAKYTGSYGNLVKIDHGNGVETWYGHTSKMYVNVGEKVKAGDVIAAVGSTGNSTGPHLHLEIRINGQHVNPQKYLYNK